MTERVSFPELKTRIPDVPESKKRNISAAATLRS